MRNEAALTAGHYLGLLDHVDRVARACRGAVRVFEGLADDAMRYDLQEIRNSLDTLAAETARRRTVLALLSTENDHG